ncbi:MAG: NUDIX domain-containing protein [Bacteroidales bacterium]|nr:NUDIX domain-containing protein [Bacteroidales bacterium]
MLPLVEPSGLVYGQATREYCHSGSHVLHPVVHLHIIDHFGKLYLQKRSMTKDLLPGYWDTAVGGHVSYGETILEALYRETSEELGLTAFNPIGLGAYIWQTQRDNEYVFVHAILGHPTLHPNAEEVSEGRWWTFEELDRAMGQNVLTPNFESEFGRIRDRLLAML